MLRTGKQYLEFAQRRTRRLGRQRQESTTSQPIRSTRDYAQRTAEFFDLHRRADLQDHLTFVDATGMRRSMMWFSIATRKSWSASAGTTNSS